MYDAEVNNGGHSQYCVNPSGNDWKIALAGLRAIGAPSRAAILQDAAALFGTDGPAVDTETRRKQLIALTKQQQEAMSALDDRYYRNTENLEALLAQFAINNREHFGGKQ
ncbi:MAG: DMP19 family protein [Planctomycetota bacterium]